MLLVILRHPTKTIACKLKKSREVLTNTRCNFCSVIADKQNMMNTCVRHKGKCCKKILETGKFQWIYGSQKSLNQSEQHTWHHFLKISKAADDNQITQFSDALKPSNKIKLKSRLPPFFLFIFQFWCAFSFWFHNLPHLSYCCYALTVWLCL